MRGLMYEENCLKAVWVAIEVEYIRDLWEQFLRFETETEEIQSQQARPRLLFTNIQDWDRDQENVYFRDLDRDRDQENGRDRDWNRDSCWSYCRFYIQFGPNSNF